MRTAYALVGLVLGIVPNEAVHRGIGGKEADLALEAGFREEPCRRSVEVDAASKCSCAFTAQDYYDR